MGDQATGMSAFITRELAKVRDVYVTAPERIIGDYNTENEKISDYKGRELLEMLQNADDESDIAQDKVAYIELKDGFLTIANNGQPFSEDGVTSLIYSHLSPKYKRQNKIGSKGTGFRSILSWAKQIFIKSLDLSIEFSKENAISFLNGLVLDNPNIRRFLAEKSPFADPIAILLTPKWKDTETGTFSDYDTYIVVELKESVEADVQRQIDGLDKEVLLFLHNLQRIVLNSPGRREVIRKEPTYDGKIEIKVESMDGSFLSNRTWLIKEKQGTYENRNYELKVAYNEALDDSKNILYSYFKTDVRFPFPAVIHGTFELTGNRNQLTRSEVNKFLLGELAQLLIDVALQIANKDTEPSWTPFRLLSFTSGFDQAITDLGFENILLEKIKSNRLFPTVVGNYITHADKPKVYRKDYAAILHSKPQFSKLTIHSADENVWRLLNRLSWWKYDAQWFFSQLSAISKSFSLEGRAKLIVFILQDYEEALKSIPKEKLPTLFMDDSDNVIGTNIEVILPPEKEAFTIPNYVHLRFLNAELFEYLCRELNIKGARALRDKLSAFDVQEYSFETVLRRVVAGTKEQIEKKKSKKLKYIRTLVQFLWQSFSRGNVSDNIPKDIDVPLLNRFEAVVSASRLYLGKDYGDQVTENLLRNVDKKIFVASAKLLGLGDKDADTVKRFLLWLRVAQYPRFLQKRFSQPQEAEYVHFVYNQLARPIIVGDLSFDSAQDLIDSSIGHRTFVEVETIESLEQILNKALTEDILLWLIKDQAIARIISDKTEKNASSNFKIDFHGKSKTRYLRSNGIFPYALWVLRSRKWVKTKSERRVEPTICCLSKAIGPDFSPIIEAPDVDYNSKKFVQAKVSREDIEHLLAAVGVASDLTRFPTDTIYSILLNLPELDAAGDKAKLIYKQIIENRSKDQIDRSSPAYKQFQKEGKVLAILSQQKSYKPLQSVYYVENRTFCQDVINQFPVLDLDKRVGKDKVRSVLGVKPLEEVSFRVKGEPKIHPLGIEFGIDFEEFKPYVYALRVEKDPRHAQLSALKQSKVTLCTDVAASYFYNGEERGFSVESYEHIFISKANNVYLKVEADLHNSLSDFRRDIRFCETVAEIVSGLFKVEENRETIGNLYSRDEHQRKELLRMRLDDDELVSLDRAYKLLEITTDPQKDFWHCVYRAAKPSSSFPEFTDDDKLKDLLQHNLRLDESLIGRLLRDIDYDDLNSPTNLAIIIELFRKIGIDIAVFNQLTTRTLNLTEYYRGLLDALKHRYQRQYDSHLYTKLKKESVEKKKTFLLEKYRYEEFDGFVIENSVAFVPEDYFRYLLKVEFDCDLTDIENQQVIDLTELYNANKDKLKQALLGKHPVTTHAYLETFLNDKRFRSLIYFGEADYLEKEFADKYGHQPEAMPQPQSKTIEFYGNRIPYQSLEKLGAAIGENLLRKDLQILNVTPCAVVSLVQKSGKAGTSRSSGARPRRPNEETGFLGECTVYSLLTLKYGKEKVFWVSENALKAGINENGSEGFHYDMRYVDGRGKTMYVEVKASVSNDLIFHITPEEVAFAEEKKDDYEIYFLPGINSSDAKALKIPGLFRYKKGESFAKNSKFSVENDSFTIEFRLGEKDKK